VNNKDYFYTPCLINTLIDFLKTGIPDNGLLPYHRAFIKNIGYSLQYLDFLDHEMKYRKFHSTISVHLCKTFIITGMGIVEALLWYALEKDAHKLLEQKETQKPNVRRESLNNMIRNIESKKLLGDNAQIYGGLNQLRVFRNRIHIRGIQHNTDTDWLTIGDKEVVLMKKTLYSLFTQSGLFPVKENRYKIFSYLKVEDVEQPSSI
jgi:hypothetical protein